MKTPIKSINELIHELLNMSVDNTYGSVMKRVDIDPLDFEPYISWNEDHHTRNLLYKCSEFELLLACSLPNQKTAIHNYGHQQGWAVVISGEMTEVRFLGSESFNSVVEISKNILKPGSVSYINDYQGLHQFINSYDGKTLTLHLFVLPFERYKKYNTETEEFEEVPISYDNDFRDEFK